MNSNLNETDDPFIHSILRRCIEAADPYFAANVFVSVSDFLVMLQSRPGLSCFRDLKGFRFISAEGFCLLGVSIYERPEIENGSVWVFDEYAADWKGSLFRSYHQRLEWAERLAALEGGVS